MRNQEVTRLCLPGGARRLEQANCLEESSSLGVAFSIFRLFSWLEATCWVTAQIGFAAGYAIKSKFKYVDFPMLFLTHTMNCLLYKVVMVKPLYTMKRRDKSNTHKKKARASKQNSFCSGGGKQREN